MGALCAQPFLSLQFSVHFNRGRYLLPVGAVSPPPLVLWSSLFFPGLDSNPRLVAFWLGDQANSATSCAHALCLPGTLCILVGSYGTLAAYPGLAPRVVGCWSRGSSPAVSVGYVAVTRFVCLDGRFPNLATILYLAGICRWGYAGTTPSPRVHGMLADVCFSRLHRRVTSAS
jgi:hypothetical protein